MTEDSLLPLVLARVADTWQEVLADVTKAGKRPPSAFIVYQCAQADWDMVECEDPVLRTWVFDGAKAVEREPTRAELVGVEAGKGMCFPTGRVWFHLDGSGRVVFTYRAGPRLGRGVILREAAGALVAEPSSAWAS